MFVTTRPRRALSSLVLGGLVATPLAVAAPPASAAPTAGQVVISEVYGGGGSSTGTPSYKIDFVELKNLTGSPVDLTGTSIQYRSATGTANPSGVTALTGTIAANGYYTVSLGSTGTAGADLPPPNQVGSTGSNLSGTAGTIFFANQAGVLTAPPTGSVVGNAAILDLVGYGTSNTFETAAVGALSTTTSAQRNAAGADTNSNVADLTVATPTPGEGPGGTEPPAPEARTIEQIQGTGAASPLAGTSAITTGVVTATYPTGGFNGFYIQQLANTATDAAASDGLFVFSSAEVGEVALGDYVEITGLVTEFNGLTEITPQAGGGVSVKPLPAGAIVPTAAAVAFPELESAREALEGMLISPQGAYTVGDTFNLNRFAEVGLAKGTTPLVTPTEVADAQDTAAIAAANAEIAARKLALDDGASIDFQSSANGGANKNLPLPWLTTANPIRTGAAVAFHGNVILDWRNSTWKFQPTTRLTDDGAALATFENTREAAPKPVGGDVKIASFNVLNYFIETGADYVAGGGSCTFFTDRAGNPITNNDCGATGPRGAANDENLARQQAKIVKAINALGADVVSLEEIENSAKFGAGRDAALSTLVDALNADAGSAVWGFAPTPATAGDQATEDVIRTAFIYKTAKVEPVGPSVILQDAAFNNARDPLAQGFKPVGGPASSVFAAIVNHFKSKSSGVDDGTGQGLANPDRIAQANALVAFADQVKTAFGTDKVFLTGDFNSYTREDPLQVLYNAGYTDVGAALHPEEYTYVFSGLVGSLDHVLANQPAMASVTGAHVWNINAVESVALEYSRFNYNVTNFYEATPFRSSDHDPLVVGVDLPEPARPTTLNLLAINDFHGRIDTNTTKFATTVEQLRAAGGEDKTLFLSAGDNVGASLFASASADDNPTIDVLNALGLKATALGNHELDKGFADLTGHIRDRADYDILGANVYNKGTTTPALDEYKVYTVDGVKVGVIGAVTAETPSLVSPGGITTIDVGDPVAAINRVADQLTDGNAANGEADVLIATLHEGAAGTTAQALADEANGTGAFHNIVANTTAKVDAIITGHTHKEYVWDAPVPGAPAGCTSGTPGCTRPMVQTGEYGNNVGRITLTVQPDKSVSAYTVSTTDRVGAENLSFPRVAQVKQITDAALAAANEVGKQPVGSVAKDITTAYATGHFESGVWVGPNPADPKAGRDDRASESTLGNVVGDALKASVGGADLGIVNPGGLRDELFFKGTGIDGNNDGVITYAEANAVLPFVNNVCVATLTGAQLKKVLEQQWQRNADDTVPSRAFLQLGLSRGTKVVLDPSKPEGSRVVKVVINGQPLDPAATYKVATFTFLCTGGDNFRAFNEGTWSDTGLVDRDAWIDYLGDHQGLSPDFTRRQVYAAGFPATVTGGSDTAFDLTKLNLTSLGTPETTSVAVWLAPAGGGAPVKAGDFAVTAGNAHVAIPGSLTTAGASYTVSVVSNATGVLIGRSFATSTTSATGGPFTYGAPATVHVTVASDPVATGTVTVLEGNTVLGTATLAGGAADVAISATALSAGPHTLTVTYAGTADVAGSSTTLALTVAKGASDVAFTVSPTRILRKVTQPVVTITAGNATSNGGYELRVNGVRLAFGNLSAGTASVTLPAFKNDGTYTFEVRYLGDANHNTSEATRFVTVVKK